jgi:hypothetical protein
MKDRIVVVAVFAVVIGSAVGFQLAGSDHSKPRLAAPPAPPAAPVSVGQFRGFCLQLNNGQENHPYEQYVEEIAATGANTICLAVPAFQENGASTSIFIDLRKAPTSRRLGELMDLARAKGLRVVLMPMVLLENARAQEWRGKIEPANWQDWWEDYENLIMHYVWLAEAHQADMFMIGSELLSTESHEDRWRGLIARVRKAYQGRLCYSANWDHYKSVTWWGDLDLVGMTTYHDLTGGEPPTLERMLEAWDSIKQQVLEWQAEIQRPILFTEVGWPNQDTAPQYPWDYYRRVDNPAPDLQARCFESFFQAWQHEPAVAGYLIWEWRNYPSQVTDPSHDTSYVPCDKPAMDIIRRYMRIPPPEQTAAAQAQEQAAPVANN